MCGHEGSKDDLQKHKDMEKTSDWCCYKDI